MSVLEFEVRGGERAEDFGEIVRKKQASPHWISDASETTRDAICADGGVSRVQINFFSR